MKKASFFPVIWAIFAIVLSGAIAMALDQQGEQVQKGKQVASPTSPSTGPQETPIAPLSSIVDDPELRKQVEEFEKLLAPFEVEGAALSKALQNYAEEAKNSGGVENLSPQKLSVLRIKLGEIAKKGKESAVSFLQKKAAFESILAVLERNLDKSAMNTERDFTDAVKHLEAIKNDQLIKTKEAKDSLLVSATASIDSFAAQINSIKGWHGRRMLIKERVDEAFAVAGHCAVILGDCEKILLIPSNLGAALARLEAHVANLHAFTLKMAQETKHLANDLGNPQG